MVKLSKAEQETIIQFTSDGKTANIYSTYGPWIEKIKKLGGKQSWQNSNGWEVDVPKEWIKVKPPRELSPAQKVAASKAVKKAQEARRARNK